MPVDDDDDRIDLGDDLFGERQTVEQCARDGFGVGMGRGGAAPAMTIEFLADQMQPPRRAVQLHVDDYVRGDAAQRADLGGLARVEGNGDAGCRVAVRRREFQRVAGRRQAPARAARAEPRVKHLVV
ncbi:hypothetical protein OKW49_002145 [Paraburkholderia youngii]